MKITMNVDSNAIFLDLHDTGNQIAAWGDDTPSGDDQLSCPCHGSSFPNPRPSVMWPARLHRIR